MKFKQITILAALIFSGAWMDNIYGQLVENFESAICPTHQHCGGIIDPACLPTGGTSHGTPEIVNRPCTGPGNNNMVYMSIKPGRTFGEGIFFNFDFFEGGIYNVSFNVSVESPDDFDDEFVLNVKAANDLVHFIDPDDQDCSGTPPAVDQEDITPPLNANTLTGEGTICVSRSFNYCPSRDFNRFWLYPERIMVPAPGVVFYIDNVVIREACGPPIVYTDVSNDFDIPEGENTHETITSIDNEGLVTNDDEAVTLLIGHEWIHFRPFTHLTASQGVPEAFLHAYIDPCFEICDNNVGGGGGGGGGEVPPRRESGERSGFGRSSQNENKIQLPHENGTRDVTGKTYDKNYRRNLFMVSPNPNTGQFTVHFDIYKIQPENGVELYLMNMLGEVIYSETLDEVQPNMSFGHDYGLENSGVYMLILKEGGKIIQSEKIIVEQGR